MTTVDDIRDQYSQLLAGWNEHIEYAITINGNTEQRAKTIRHPALIAELQQAATATLTMAGGSKAERPPPGKPGSRPPLQLTPYSLLEDIQAEAADLHEMLRYWQGYDQTCSSNRRLAATLHDNIAICEKLQHYNPAPVERTRASARKWVRQARLMLGHDQRQTTLRGTVCGTCGGGLAVAVDASTDVKCVGDTDNQGGCGQIYPRSQWIELATAGKEQGCE